MALPLTTSHTWAVPSADTAATRLPSGENAAFQIWRAGPVITEMSEPSSAFHARTAPSEHAVTSMVPSLENATQFTGPSC